MPAFFINPLSEEHIDLLNKLDEQNQDLRVFISDKNSKDFICLLYTSPSPRDATLSRMPSSA